MVAHWAPAGPFECGNPALSVDQVDAQDASASNLWNGWEAPAPGQVRLARSELFDPVLQVEDPRGADPVSPRCRRVAENA